MTRTVEEVRRELFESRMDALDKNPGLWLDGGYSNVYGQCAWIGFNAALDAVEIQLPPLNNSHIGGPDSEMGPSYEQVEDAGYDFAIKDCRAAIEQTGLGLRIK